MANVHTITEWDRVRDFINTWLKDTTIYCNNCDVDFMKGMPPCCEKVQLGNNLQHTFSLIQALKEQRKHTSNVYASNKTNTMRWGISLPPRLYHSLNIYYRDVLGKKFFDNKEDMRKFARKFPEFTIPERI